MVTEALGLLKHALTLEPTNAHAKLYQSKLREEAAQDHLVGVVGGHAWHFSYALPCFHLFRSSTFILFPFYVVLL